MSHWYIGQSVQNELGEYVPPPWADAQWDVAGRTLLRAPAPSPSSRVLYLGEGDPREIKPSKTLRTALAEAFGVEVRGATLAEILATRWSEADLCLMPYRGQVAIHLGDAEPVSRIKFEPESPAGLRVLSRVRRDYERLREEWKAEALSLKQLAEVTKDKDVADALQRRAEKIETQHEKLLGATILEYRGVARELLLPEKYQDDAPRKPETSYSENFDGSDKSGVGYQQTWTEVVGTFWSNSSNQARFGGTSVALLELARMEADLSSTNHFAYASLHSISGATGTILSGVSVRMASSSDDGYHSRNGITGPSAPLHRQDLFRRVSGASTLIGSLSAITITSGLPKVARLQIDGSVLTRYFDGALLSTDSDGNISSGVRCGLRGTCDRVGNFATWDDFHCEDILTGGPAERRVPRGVGRGVMRGAA